MNITKNHIDNAIIKIANEELNEVLYGTSGAGIEHRALHLLEKCCEVKGYVAMAYWTDNLTDEEFREYNNFVYDMVFDAHDLAFFGHFM